MIGKEQTYKEKLIDFQNRAERAFEKEKNLRNAIRYFIAFWVFMLSTFWAGVSLPFRLQGEKKAVSSAGPVALTEENMEEMAAENELVLLDFWAEWCGPCMLMEDALKSFSSSNANVRLGKVNVDKSPDLAKRFRVKGIHQLVLLKGGKEIKRNVGPMTSVELARFVEV